MDHRTRLIVSLVFKLLAAVLAAGAFLGFSVAIGHDGSFVFKALCGTAGAFCGVLASYAYIYSKRLVALSASELRKTDPRPPVFYLRAFQDDWKTADLRQTDIPVFHSFSTEQEHLERALRRVGPVVAAATPREKLPHLGFGGVSMDDRWKEDVLSLMKQSSLVVLRCATTDSVLWEVDQAVKAVAPERLLLLVPASAVEYEAFRIKMGGMFPKPLPEFRKSRKPPKATVAAIIYFDRDWTPCLVPLEIPAWRGETLTAAMIHAMKPVYGQLGLAWRAAPFSLTKLALAGWGLTMAGVVIYLIATASQSTDLSQDSCSRGRAADLGRATLDPDLSVEKRNSCCARYPWLLGC